jgi:hypothetical protein
MSLKITYSNDSCLVIEAQKLTEPQRKQCDQRLRKLDGGWDAILRGWIISSKHKRQIKQILDRLGSDLSKLNDVSETDSSDSVDDVTDATDETDGSLQTMQDNDNEQATDSGDDSELDTDENDSDLEVNDTSARVQLVGSSVGPGKTELAHTESEEYDINRDELANRIDSTLKQNKKIYRKTLIYIMRMNPDVDQNVTEIIHTMDTNQVYKCLWHELSDMDVETLNKVDNFITNLI